MIDVMLSFFLVRHAFSVHWFVVGHPARLLLLFIISGSLSLIYSL